MVALLLVAGCSAAPDAPGEREAPAGPGATSGARPLHVALGDSFAAAPYVPVTDLAGGCFRSSGNYPALVAEERGARLRDVTCSGADTDDVTGRQVVGRGRGTVPAQVRAVPRRADVVTMTIGGNDENLFATLVRGCTAVADRPGAPCRDRLAPTGESVPALLTRVGGAVTAALRAVRRAAPRARVLLVGYPRLVDPDLACDRIPLAPGDRPFLARVERLLNAAMREAAARADVGFVDVHPASRGHEICSSEPWVNGLRTDEGAALAFHPFAAGQRAVADLVLRRLDG